MAELEVRGLKELEDTLNQLPAELQKKALATALRKAGKVIEDEAKMLAPRGSGELVNKIKTVVKVDVGKGGEATARIVSGSRKSHLIEFGTATHNLQVKKKRVMAAISAYAGGRGLKGNNQLGYIVFGTRAIHPGTKARPYMRPAFDSKSGESLKVFTEQLREAIIKVVRAAYKKRKVNAE